MECPILGLMGGADPMIPANEVDDFRKALNDAGVKNEIISYEGAPHSFVDRAFDQFKDQCDDAWRRMLAFMREWMIAHTACESTIGSPPSESRASRESSSGVSCVS